MNTKLFHLSKRKELPWYSAWAIRGAAIVLALVVCAIVTTALTGENPFAIYKTMWAGAFGTSRRIWNTLQYLALLLCVSLAVTPAFRMKFWNVGGEGQVLMGGLATSACMILLGDKLPNYILIPVMIVAALLAGAVWGGIPAFFKAKWNTNETLFTLMMNYVATQLVAYFIIVWEVPKGAGQIGIINQDTMAGWLPHKDIEETLRILNSFIEGKKTFALEYNEKVIGSLEVKKYNQEELPEFESFACREIGYVLSKDYWGLGLMPEAVNEVIRFLFEEIGLDVIFCSYFVRNSQSARVQEKCGFRFYKQVVHTTRFGTEEITNRNLLRREDWEK